MPRVALEWDSRSTQAWQAVDGTLVFVDISGFTKLSERLARLGRIGAEELTAVLNAVFGEMLELSAARGGTLLKFGGDALLLLFTGDAHALQACSAAVEMRRALRLVSQRTTAVGRVHLGMSVGVNTGPVHLFRVTGSHTEVLVAGPAASMVAELEHAASAGEILVGSMTRAALPVGATTPHAAGSGALLRWRVAPGDAPGIPPRPVTAGLDVPSFLPVALRRRLLDGPLEPEHRVAAVGFIRFEGVDGMLATEGPEVVAGALAELLGTTLEAADREEATFLASDVDIDGGKLILVGGVPATLDDDDGRLLRSLRRVLDTPTRLPKRAGANRGHVFAGEVGRTERATFTVMGDAVNLAARLMAAAPPGALYATAGVLEGSHTRFATTALEPMRVRGKAEPVEAFAVGAEIGDHQALVADELPFLGRTAEWATVVEALQTGGCVTVIAEAGLGKSRLLAEALAACPDLPRLEILGEAYGASTPYRALHGPVRELLGLDPAGCTDAALAAAVDAVDPTLSPWLPLIGEVAGVEMAPTAEVEAVDPRFRLDRVAEVVQRLLDRLLAVPGAIVVDDAHWLDGAGCHLLDRIAGGAADRGWSVIVLRRPSDGGYTPGGGRHLRLAPLASSDAAALVVAATETAPLRAHEVDAVVERAAGHPLFIHELVRLQAAPGGTALPDSLEAVISSQLDRLDPLTQRILRYAAVLGRRFPMSVANEILEADDIELDLPTLARLGEFLELDGDHARFRHALFQEVAYGRLSYERRRHLHAKAAEAIERLGPDDPNRSPELLSLHYAMTVHHDRTWSYAVEAGDRARAAAANADAAVQYERAVEAAARMEGLAPAELASVLGRLGAVRDLSGDFDRAYDAYRRASHLVADDPVAAAELLERRARARERAGSYFAALHEVARGRRLLEGVDGSDAAAVWARLASLTAVVRQAQGRAREARDAARKAIDLATVASEPVALARGYLVLDWAHLMLGEPDLAINAPAALTIYEEIGDLDGQSTVLNNIGADAYFRGDWDEAIDCYSRSRDSKLQAGSVYQAAMMNSNLGEVLVNQGRLDEAEPLLEEASRVQRASGFLDGAAFAEVQLGRIALARGDLVQAEARLTAAYEEFLALGARDIALDGAIHLAECRVAEGDADGALALLDTAVAAAGSEAQVFGIGVARVRALAHELLGDRSLALSEVTSGIEHARSLGVLYDEARLLLLRADLLERSGTRPDRGEVARARSILAQLGVVDAGELSDRRSGPRHRSSAR